MTGQQIQVGELIIVFMLFKVVLALMGDRFWSGDQIGVRNFCCMSTSLSFAATRGQIASRYAVELKCPVSIMAVSDIV